MSEWGNYLSNFKGHLESVEGLAANTVLAYTRDCEAFVKFLQADKSNGEEPGVISVSQGRLFLISLKKKGLKQVSIARKIDSLKKFGDYLVASKKWPSNPFRDLPYPKAEHYRAEYMTPEEAFGMLSAEFRSSFIGVRDRAMLDLFYSAGLRLSELVSIDIKDIQFRERHIRIIGKGSKYRIVPLGQKTGVVLQEYLRKRAEKLSSEKHEPKAGSAVFINDRGSRLTSRSAARIVKGYLIKSSEKQRLSTHSLRHSFATHLLEAGANLKGCSGDVGPFEFKDNSEIRSHNNRSVDFNL